MVKTGVAQFEAEPDARRYGGSTRVLPVDSGTDSISGLTVCEVFHELQHGDEHQTPGAECGLASGGVEGAEVLVGEERAEFVSEDHCSTGFWEAGSGDTDG